jgi:ribosomal protein L37AE/L43A
MQLDCANCGSTRVCASRLAIGVWHCAACGQKQQMFVAGTLIYLEDDEYIRRVEEAYADDARIE